MLGSFGSVKLFKKILFYKIVDYFNFKSISYFVIIINKSEMKWNKITLDELFAKINTIFEYII